MRRPTGRAPEEFAAAPGHPADPNLPFRADCDLGSEIGTRIAYPAGRRGPKPAQRRTSENTSLASAQLL